MFFFSGFTTLNSVKSGKILRSRTQNIRIAREQWSLEAANFSKLARMLNKSWYLYCFHTYIKKTQTILTHLCTKNRLILKWYYMEWCSCKHELNNKAFHPKDETSHPNNSQPTTTVTSRSPWPVASAILTPRLPARRRSQTPPMGLVTKILLKGAVVGAMINFHETNGGFSVIFFDM